MRDAPMLRPAIFCHPAATASKPSLFRFGQRSPPIAAMVRQASDSRSAESSVLHSLACFSDHGGGCQLLHLCSMVAARPRCNSHPASPCPPPPADTPAGIGLCRCARMGCLLAAPPFARFARCPGGTVYIPSFFEAMGRKNRLMLATIILHGCNLQSSHCKCPICYIWRTLLTKFNKSDILNNSDTEFFQFRPNSDPPPTQLRFLSVPRFFLHLHPFEVYPKGATSMVPPHWRQTKHPYFLCQKVICFSVMLAVRSAPWCFHAPMVSRLSAQRLMW